MSKLTNIQLHITQYLELLEYDKFNKFKLLGLTDFSILNVLLVGPKHLYASNDF